MLRPRLRLSLAAGASGLLLGGLLAHRPGLRGPVPQWSGDDIALAAAWMGAVVCSAWVTVVALATTVALGARGPRLAEVVARAAPRWICLLAGVAVVTSTLAVSSALPATAATDEPVVRTPAPPPTRAAPAPTAPASRPVRHQSPPSTHVVQPGDNLWRVARDTLVVRGTAAPADREITTYWRRVIAANLATLRSGDANLIYPGEVITLPRLP